MATPEQPHPADVLRHAEAQFRYLFENSLDAAFLSQPDGTITAANPAACKLLGMSEDELCRVGRSGIVDPTDHRYAAALEERSRNGSVRAEMTFIRKDGTKFQGEVSSVLIDGANPQVVVTLRDISARKAAEETVRASEARHRAFFDLATVGLAEADPATGRLLRVNQKLCEITGYPQAELLQKTIKDITHPEDQQTDSQLFKAMLADPAVAYRNVKRYLRKDGTVIWGEVNATSVRDEQGRAIRTVAVITDITERKRADDALRESRSHLQILIKHAPAAIAMFDMQLRYLMVSDRWISDYHLGQQKIIGRTHYEVFPEVPEHWKAIHRRCLAGAVERCEADPFVRADGSTQWLRWEIQPWYTASGEQSGILMLTEDITERKSAEQAHLDAAAQMQGVINNAVDGILTIDEQGKIEWLNPAAVRIFGYTQDELVGKDINVLMPEPYHSEHDQYIASYRKTGQAKIIGIGRELRGQRKDGSIFPIELAVSEVKLGNRRIFTGTVRDITQRKAIERSLVVAKEAAEASNTAKDHFLAVLSHELRTPLAPVMIAAQVMEGDTTLSPEQHESVSMIHRNVVLEARLIDDLLDLTRIVRGKLELNFTTVDLHERLRHVVAMCAGEMATKQLNLTVKLEAGGHHVSADPARLQQILWNILKNAVKFTPEDGSITVRTHNPDEGYVLVTIQDTGVGIESELLPRLFNAFEQGGKDVTRQFGGLGLGLVISKGLVDLHGGTLVAESEGQGKGATFTLTLPTISEAKSQPSHAGGAESLRALAATRRVLLVEDHPDTAKVMASLLTSYGFAVTLARSVQETMRVIQGESFDLFISDIGLPDGSGLDLMRHIAATKPMKAIALSGFGMEEDVRRSREAGFLAHLTKPVDLKVLERMLVNILASPVG